MGSQNSLHIEGQSSQFGLQNKNGSQTGAGSGLNLPTLPPGTGGNILEQIEQYQMYQRQGGPLPADAAAQLAAAGGMQSNNAGGGQQPGQQQYQVNAKGQPVNAQGQRIRTTGPPGMRGQPMSENSSSMGGSGIPSVGTGSNQMQQLTEQNLLKQIGLDLRTGGSYAESSNSGSDITLRLFDRLRAQQKLQKEQKEKEKVLHQQQQNTQQNPQNLNQQQNNQVILGLIQNMQSMSPKDQQDYFNLLIQQQQSQQNPMRSTDISNSIAALGLSQDPLAIQFIQQLRQYEQQQDQILQAHLMQQAQNQQMPTGQTDMNQQQIFDQQQQQLQQQQLLVQQQQYMQQQQMHSEGQQQQQLQANGQQQMGESPDMAMAADSLQQEQQQNWLNKVEHIFEWSFGGENVEICAEFNKWQGEKMEKIVPGQAIQGTGLLQAASLQNKIGQQPPTHYFVKFLDPKRYEYKFRVDGNWRYAPDQQITRDERGNENNVVDLTNGKTVLQLLQERQQNFQQQPNLAQNQQQPAPHHQQLLFLLQQVQNQFQTNTLPNGLNVNPAQLTPQYLNEQKNLLLQTSQALQLMTQPENIQIFDPQQQQQMLLLQQQQEQKTGQLDYIMKSMQVQQVQQQQMLAQERASQQQKQQIEQQQLHQPNMPQANQIPQAVVPQQNNQQPVPQSDASGSNQGRAAEGDAGRSQSSRQANNTSARNNEQDQQAGENIYNQKLPEEIDEQVQDPQVLPIHFNYNFIERDQIPVHNQQFSKINDDYSKQTEIIKKGFFDNTLPTPSHVVLNHINSWETMSSLQGSDSGSQSQQQSNSNLTCISMAQRLNRSKFLTIVYYKPSTNNN